MGAYVSLVAGLAVMAFGVWAMATTWPLLWLAVKAIVPLLCILGGLFAFLTGLGEVRDQWTRPK